jgi:sortase A
MRARRWLENFLLLAGVLAIDVWIWSHAGSVLYQQWQERVFDREVSSDREASGSDHPAESLRPHHDSGPIGRLVIPRLHVRAMVGEGTGEDTLSLAAGHIPSTALPGEPGNVGVAGHRDTIFRALRNVRKNDVILFETRRGTFSYRVSEMKIVKPTQVSVLNASDARELTLVTCYPFQYIGSAPERFIVKARQITVRQDDTRWHEKPRRPVRRKRAVRV